ncbi:tetratricopeptide repeat protein [Leptolyngbya sp. BC1307]|uniref:tetratricopeptide repeat protein n=1 Tax=Leptolyngbya sp. BC1307 TaxID=2029589 RepID=UPI000EFD7464|nr:tetratricopeptide repeat protein [Leptolyngbya sp. BC1307]
MQKGAREKIDDPAALYRSLVRALRRRSGFGILFLQCTPAKGQEIFAQLKQDLPQKRLGRLMLDEPIDNLRSLIEAREDLAALNVLFIEGIDKSLAPYLKTEAGRNDYYKLEVLPPILNHLNRQREDFHRQFSHLCLVFVVRPFALKYFMHRAVDFFDWRSGIWTFAADNEQLTQETAQVLGTRYSEYVALSETARIEKIAKLQDLIDEKNQSDERRSQLLVEQSWVFGAGQDFAAALRCCEGATALQSTNDNAWYARGYALRKLGRSEEAIAAYDAALAIQPDYHDALYNKGYALDELGRYEEAIAAYDAALAIQPGKHAALDNKGIALGELGRYEEAIAAYDAALAIQPDNASTWYNKACSYALSKRLEDALTCLQKAIELDGTDKYSEMAKTDTDFDDIRDSPQFLALISEGQVCA